MERENYEDYRAVDGVRYAFTVQAIDDHEVPFTINYTDIRLNVAISDEKFEKPAAKASVAQLSAQQPEMVEREVAKVDIGELTRAEMIAELSE